LKPQAPPTQVATAETGAGHSFSQVPQLLVFVLMSTQSPPQRDRPAPHDALHAPEEQTSEAAHSVGQAPQWEASDDRSTHALPQGVKPAAQVEPQTPELQVVTAFGVCVQAMLQPPQ
jgi:hypothetical protein